MRGGLRGTWQDTNARVITDGALITRVRAALRKKYGWQVAIFDLVARLTGRAKRRAWIEIAI